MDPPDVVLRNLSIEDSASDIFSLEVAGCSLWILTEFNTAWRDSR